MVLPASQPYPRRSDRHAKVRRIVPSLLNIASSVSPRYSPDRYEVSVLLAIANRDGSHANNFFTGKPAR
jgi:hypothetical protein